MSRAWAIHDQPKETHAPDPYPTRLRPAPLALPGLAQAQATSTFPAAATVLQTANLRASASTGAARVGSAPAGSSLTLTGCNAACDWYQTADGAWIAAFLVEVQAGRAGALASPTVCATS